jgi:hypothetical protein
MRRKIKRMAAGYACASTCICICTAGARFKTVRETLSRPQQRMDSE